LTGDIYAKYGLIADPQKHLDVSYHRIGHYLGLDIHDVGRTDASMEAGVVITVEPGLYLPQERLGIRIEDNILITESGCQVLSADIPKEIEAIERMMAAWPKPHIHQ
jgi:Xaa-Pro aminopeptidase